MGETTAEGGRVMSVLIPQAHSPGDAGRVIGCHIARVDGTRCGGEVVIRWNDELTQCEPHCSVCGQKVSEKDVYDKADACPRCGLYCRPDLGGEWERNTVYNVCAGCLSTVRESHPMEYRIRQVVARECIAKGDQVFAQENGGRYVLGYVVERRAGFSEPQIVFPKQTSLAIPAVASRNACAHYIADAFPWEHNPYAVYRPNSELNPEIYVDLITDEPRFQVEEHRELLKQQVSTKGKGVRYALRSVIVGNTCVGYAIYRGDEIVYPYQKADAPLRVATKELCERWLGAVPEDRTVLERLAKLFAEFAISWQQVTPPKDQEPLLGGFRKAMDYARNHGPCRIRGRLRSSGSVELEFRIEQYMKSGLSHYRITAINLKTGKPHPLPVGDYDGGTAYSRNKAWEVLEQTPQSHFPRIWMHRKYGESECAGNVRFNSGFIGQISSA